MTTFRERNQWFGLDANWLPVQPPRDNKDEITPGVWVGNQYAARRLVGVKGWTIIDVREVDPGKGPNVINIPTLTYSPKWRDAKGRQVSLAGKKQLGKIARAIDTALEKGNRVLVHCWAGMERSPLAVAWWLCTRKAMSLDEAYATLKAARPVVEDRRGWLTLKAFDVVDPWKEETAA